MGVFLKSPTLFLPQHSAIDECLAVYVAVQLEDSIRRGALPEHAGGSFPSSGQPEKFFPCRNSPPFRVTVPVTVGVRKESR
jgi:hypothetical protein